MVKLIRRLLCGMTALCMTVLLLVPCMAHADYSTEKLDSIVKGYSRKVSVILATADGEMLYSYQPDLYISGASLIKLPYAVYVCRKLTAGVRSLDEKITYTKSFYHGGDGVIVKGAYGTEYTIRELLDYMLRYSDNVAYDMLVYLFGINDFNAMIKSWGYSVSIATPSPRFPGLTATFMHRAMLEMQMHCNDGECWQVCWNALRNSTNVKLRNVYPEDIGLAVKYGEVETVHHEVCFVEDEMPYVLILMTGIVNEKPDVPFIESVGTEVQQLMADYNATPPLPGDIDYSTTVNASDAARVLIASAALGAGGTLGLSSRQQRAGDVNADGDVNASDAALILQYAALSGTGSETAPAEFFGAVDAE
ncbi:MAG: serine hydrolase [Oscillospiraceae bacterium]|nr:serine hydrolase [Oscillospiraceae bacterium]